MKKCSVCKVVKPKADFYKRSDTHGDGLQGTCKACMVLIRRRCRTNPEYVAREKAWKKEYRRKNPEICHKEDRRLNLRRWYNISVQQYNKLFEQQGGVCAICGKPETAMFQGETKFLAVDHCHKTGMIRGLLCLRCNTGIGLFCHDLDILAKAEVYLLA